MNNQPAASRIFGKDSPWKRIEVEKPFRIDGNVRPVGFEQAKWTFLRFDKNLRTFRLPIKFSNEFCAVWILAGRILPAAENLSVDQFIGNGLGVIGKFDKMIEAKAYFNRSGRADVGCGDHDIIGAINLCLPEIQFPVGPNLQWFHKDSFSDGESLPSLETGAGDASSIARKGLHKSGRKDTGKGFGA